MHGGYATSASAPTVSVVTVFHNRAAHVADSVGSLLAQEDADFEIIAVDDGSTDDTLARLRAIDDPRLIVVAGRNTGFTRAINTAIARARGQYIAIHGAGDISAPERIAKQAAVLDSRPGVGVVACYVRNDAKLGADSYVVRPPEGLPFFATLLDRNLFTHGEVMFRRSLFDRVGGYREMFTYAQDRDLWLRMSRHADYAVVPEVLYERRRFAGSVSRDPDKVLLQAYASDFAVQLATVAKGDPDALARHGPLATLLRRPSRRLARTIAWAGARQMLNGDLAGGWALVSRAAEERLTRQVAIIWLLCVTWRVAPVWNVVRRLLAWRLLRFDR